MLSMSGIDQMKARLRQETDRKFRAAAMYAINSILIEIVNAAKEDSNGFTDRTGNLRNSIGYVPAFRGSVEDVKATQVRHENGTTETKWAAADGGSGDTITGVVYVGMDYGLYVEFTPGHYVIGGAWSEYYGKVKQLLIERIRSYG